MKWSYFVDSLNLGFFEKTMVVHMCRAENSQGFIPCIMSFEMCCVKSR